MSDTGSVISHFECVFTGERYDLDYAGFPADGRLLDPRYDYDELEITREDVERRSGSMWKYRELLPIRDDEHIVSLGEGNTPLVSNPRLADELDVDSLLLKDEGQNPTNTFKDRGAAASISGALQQGAREVALATAGNAGQAASAYAGAAGLDCHVYVNHQAGSVQRTLTREHGATVHLVEGKLPEAGSAFLEELERTGRYSVATFHTPFRHEGKKTMGFELFEQSDWRSPDHVVYPTGGGVGLIGIWKAYQELQELGWLEDDSPPSLHVAQSTGNAPIVDAIERGEEAHDPWNEPDTIARGVEVPDPGASPWILEAVEESGGTGVAVTDENALDAASLAARTSGVEMCAEAGVAMAGAKRLRENGTISADEAVVVINTGAGCKSAELFASGA